MIFSSRQVCFARIALALLCALPALAVADSDADNMMARQNYILNCQGCHLPDGSGSIGVVPRMTDFVGNFLHVDGGREFIVRVPGAANAPIDDTELAEVMNWILLNFSSQQLPADFTPYTSSEIASLRSRPLIDINGERAALIQRIQQQLGVKEDGLHDG